jgi:hypothetical protein
MQFDTFHNALTSPALKAIAAHWHEARQDAPMPAWEQLQPGRIAPHLTLVWAYRYDRASGQFTGRLAGGRVARAFEQNFRGLPLEEAFSPALAGRVKELMSRVVTGPVMGRCAGPLFKHAGRTFDGERICLPLASDGIHGDGVLGASAYHYPDYNPESGPFELIFEDAQWYSIRGPGHTPAPPRPGAPGARELA